jgi:hypothetical protein
MKINWKKTFIVSAFVCLSLQIIGAVISIAFAMPAQVVFGDSVLSPDNATTAIVAKEYVSSGTALAPPVILTVVFTLFFLMARRNKAWGIIGTALLSLIGVLFTFATMGEHANPDRFPLVSGEIYTTLLLLNQASSVAVPVFGILLLVSQTVQRVSNRKRPSA